MVPGFRSRLEAMMMGSLELPIRAAELDGDGPDPTVAPKLSRFGDGRCSSNSGAILVASRGALQTDLGPDGPGARRSPWHHLPPAPPPGAPSPPPS